MTLLRPAGPPLDRNRLGLEIIIVLGVTLGQSAVYSLLRIVERMTRAEPLAQQTSTLNASATTYRDAGTSKGVQYFYVVRAVNAAGEGPPSNEANAVAK